MDRNNKESRMTKQLAYVEWVDSAAIQGWQHESEVSREDYEPSVIKSVGFIVSESKKHITITTSISDTDCCMDPLTIPKCAVVKLKKVRRVK